MGKVLLRRRAVVFFLSSLRRLVQTIVENDKFTQILESFTQYGAVFLTSKIQDARSRMQDASFKSHHSSFSFYII
jgi:uncharacterized membrane protein YbaN (DUF454 family)